MPDKKFGPKIKGNIYHNNYKEGKQPDYVSRGKYAIPVTDEFLRHLVEALRGDGTEARISIGLWENEDKNGNTSFGIHMEAVSFTPQEVEVAPRQAETPPAPPPSTYDDIPF
jgi:hypothetical protein